MFLRLNANRLRLRLLKEKTALSRRLGRERLAHQKAVERAQFASDYLRQAGQVLASQSLPAIWDLRLQPQTTHRSGVTRVYMVLDGFQIGCFAIDDDWLAPYWVAEKNYFFFGRALRAASRYMARQVAYYQLLRRRMQPAVDRLREASAVFAGRATLVVNQHYDCEQEWDVRDNYFSLCFALNGQQRELRVFGDRYTWRAAGDPERHTLFTEEELMTWLDQELLALAPPAGVRALTGWLFLIGARVRNVLHPR